MESESALIFTKLAHNLYLEIDVLTYVEYEDTLKFLYGLNKEARKSSQRNFSSVRNGFVNDGLIEHYFINFVWGHFAIY